MNITLIGYRGTGKSTIAPLLAAQLGWDWVDADVYLEHQVGRSIRAIFESDGEAWFRNRESLVIAEILTRTRQVIAAGGGAVLRAENCAAMRRNGKVVWLAAPPEVIERRLCDDPSTVARRPALTALGTRAEIATLLAARDAVYRETADLIVDTAARQPAEIVDVIANSLGLGPPPLGARR